MAIGFGRFSADSLGLNSNIGKAVRGTERSWLRMVTGRRINSAADDAAGVAISAALEAQTRSYAQSERNIGSALSMVRTAESGASMIGGMLTRMRELAVQSADGALSETDRGFLDTEFQQLKAEVDRVSGTTEFNGRELLGGAAQTLDFQVGAGTDVNDRIGVEFGGVSASSLGVGSAVIGGMDGSGGVAAIDMIDDAMSALNTRRATFGAVSNRLAGAYESSVDKRTNLLSALSRIRDADIASEATTAASFQVSLQAATAIGASANQLSTIALRLLG